MINIQELRPNDWVFYPNRGLDPLNTGYHLVGKVHEVNTEGGYITIASDANSPTNQTGAHNYRCEDLEGICITEETLLNKFGFRKIHNQRLFGLPPETFFEKKVGGQTLQVIKSSTIYCVVCPSDGYFGCCFNPIVDVHRLQNLMADMAGGEVEDIPLR